MLVSGEVVKPGVWVGLGCSFLSLVWDLICYEKTKLIRILINEINQMRALEEREILWQFRIKSVFSYFFFVPPP